MADANVPTQAPAPAPSGSGPSVSVVAIATRPNMTAYQCFVNHFCNLVFDPNGSKTLFEVQKIADERWRCMSVAERRPYKEFTNQGKGRKLVGGNMPGTEAVISVAESTGRKGKRKRSTKAEKNPNAPKRAIGSFFLFSSEMRPKVKEENPDFKAAQIAKELGRMWREMSEEAKAKYQNMAAKDKERYQAETAAFKESNEAARQAAAANADDDDEEEDE